MSFTDRLIYLSILSSVRLSNLSALLGKLGFVNNLGMLIFGIGVIWKTRHIDGLVQDCNITLANALEILQFYYECLEINRIALND